MHIDFQTLSLLVRIGSGNGYTRVGRVFGLLVSGRGGGAEWGALRIIEIAFYLYFVFVDLWVWYIYYFFMLICHF